MLGMARTAHEALVELVAEGKDELLEEFFEQGTIPEQHLISALHEAIREDRIFPVLFASGETSVATDHLLHFLKVYAPAASERAPMAVGGRAAERADLVESMAGGGTAGAGTGAGSGTATETVAEFRPEE